MPGYFEVQGTRYELVPWEDWSFEEAKTFQRISGLPIGRLLLGIGEVDVNAYLGMFTVSMQRIDPTKSERDLTGLKWSEVLEHMVNVVEEPDPEPDPPTGSPSNNGESGSDDSHSLQTPVASGTPPGSDTSD